MLWKWRSPPAQTRFFVVYGVTMPIVGNEMENKKHYIRNQTLRICGIEWDEKHFGINIQIQNVRYFTSVLREEMLRV